MTQIVLTQEQANLYHQTKVPVQVCDAQGKVIGTLPPDYSDEFIAEQKRRAASPGPWYTGDKVQAMFRFLEETRAKEGEFDKSRLKALLADFDHQLGKAS